MILRPDAVRMKIWFATTTNTSNTLNCLEPYVKYINQIMRPDAVRMKIVHPSATNNTNNLRPDAVRIASAKDNNITTIKLCIRMRPG